MNNFNKKDKKIYLVSLFTAMVASASASFLVSCNNKSTLVSNESMITSDISSEVPVDQLTISLDNELFNTPYIEIDGVKYNAKYSEEEIQNILKWLDENSQRAADIDTIYYSNAQAYSIICAVPDVSFNTISDDDVAFYQEYGEKKIDLLLPSIMEDLAKYNEYEYTFYNGNSYEDDNVILGQASIYLKKYNIDVTIYNSAQYESYLNLYQNGDEPLYSSYYFEQPAFTYCAEDNNILMTIGSYDHMLWSRYNGCNKVDNVLEASNVTKKNLIYSK